METTSAAAYEEFLRKAEDLVKRLAAKQSQDVVPAELHGNREAMVIFTIFRGFCLLGGEPSMVA